MFCSAKAAPFAIKKEVSDSEGPSAEQEAVELNFVQGQSNLRQVFMRAPNDGLFPKIKDVDEMGPEDVEVLVFVVLVFCFAIKSRKSVRSENS